MSNTLEKFPWDRLVEDPEGCWVWTGTISAEGYGKYGKGAKYVHRTVYELLVADIPEGLQIDHLCRNTSCANPEHLEPVTRAVNVRRSTSPAAEQAARKACIAGHPLSGPNLYVTPQGRRQCRACRADAMTRLYARRLNGRTLR